MSESPTHAARVPDGRDARIAQANGLLTGHPPGDARHERGLQLLLAEAETADGAHARWLLGAYFLQVSSRERAHAQALHWLQLAAADGTPPAVDRLADLHLSGLAGLAAPRAALALQLRLADQCYQRAAWEAAYLVDALGAGDGPDAASAFLRACALGYPPAYFSLGLRFAEGRGVARDSAFGHALLRRAADAGHVGAAEAAAAFAPAHGDASDRWHARLRDNLHAMHPRLASLAPGRPDGQRTPHPMVFELERHLASIGHPAIGLDAAGRAVVAAGGSTPAAPPTPSWAWLSDRPRVATCRGFATREECAHLVNKVAAAMKPASAYRRGNSANEDAELASFSGRGHPIAALHTDSVTRMLERRVSALAQWPMEKLEPCSIVCYRPGEEYRPHVDFFSDAQIQANAERRRDHGGQRVATFLLYLRAPGAGGETRYPEAAVDVRGEEGMGVIHYNVTPDGAQDPASVHAGQPVLEGEKWLWRSTLREHSLYAAPVARVGAPPAP